MSGLTIYPRGDELFLDIPERRRDYPAGGVHVRMGAFDRGPTGAPCVVIAIPSWSGTWVLGETDLALFLTAAEAFVAQHGDPRRPREVSPREEGFR
jgi:hypothetical protein